MKTVDWTDVDGILRRSLLPDDADDKDASIGVPSGADLIEGLEAHGMPYQTAVRLQNELRRRGIWTYSDARKRAAEELFAALQSAYKVDIAAITNLLKEAESNG